MENIERYTALGILVFLVQIELSDCLNIYHQDISNTIVLVDRSCRLPILECGLPNNNRILRAESLHAALSPRNRAPDVNCPKLVIFSLDSSAENAVHQPVVNATREHIRAYSHLGAQRPTGKRLPFTLGQVQYQALETPKKARTQGSSAKIQGIPGKHRVIREPAQQPL